MADMRLIDANALIDASKTMIAIEWNHKVAPLSWAEAEEEFVNRLEEAPTIDAVPVARCKDCRFYEVGVEYYGGGTKDVCRLLTRQMQEDDFCSYGERKEQ